MYGLQFPHNIRKISAPSHLPLIKPLFFLFFLTIITINLAHRFFFPFTEEKLLQLQIMQNPLSSSLHEKLGQYYLPVNMAEAQKEYRLAQENFRDNQTEGITVLGKQSSPKETWENIKNQRQQLLEESKYWQELLRQYPDYQYTLLKLAAIYSQLGDRERAKEYLGEVLKQSPTDETALKFLQKLQE
ncbi:hypothetical protein HY945_02515 [Candidatus Gottesmanbacteria bacterium]|nr:hypothetical protein [Candidatus Gottesmanbacteria bacterium]